MPYFAIFITVFTSCPDGNISNIQYDWIYELNHCSIFIRTHIVTPSQTRSVIIYTVLNKRY